MSDRVIPRKEMECVGWSGSGLVNTEYQSMDRTLERGFVGRRNWRKFTRDRERQRGGRSLAANALCAPMGLASFTTHSGSLIRPNIRQTQRDLGGRRDFGFERVHLMKQKQIPSKGRGGQSTRENHP